DGEVVDNAFLLIQQQSPKVDYAHTDATGVVYEESGFRNASPRFAKESGTKRNRVSAINFTFTDEDFQFETVSTQVSSCGVWSDSLIHINNLVDWANRHQLTVPQKRTFLTQQPHGRHVVANEENRSSIQA